MTLASLLCCTIDPVCNGMAILLAQAKIHGTPAYTAPQGIKTRLVEPSGHDGL